MSYMKPDNDEDRDKIWLTWWLLWWLFVIGSVAEGAELECKYSERCMTAALYTMSPEQIDNMRYSVRAGEEFDLSLTLAAICWQESDCGRDTVNHNGDYGLYQNNINSVLNRYEAEFGEMSEDERHMQEHRLAWRLYSNRRYAAGQSIAEFQWWQMYWTPDGIEECDIVCWKNSVMSYNAGIDNRAGWKYFVQVNIKTRIVRKHMSFIMNRNKVRRVGE